jgi:hypothetical protein
MHIAEGKFMGLTQAGNLEVHEMSDGYIVYQKERDRVHHLNRTAAIVFELCDGTSQAQDVVERVAEIYALGPSAHGEIRAALDQLMQEGLVLSSSM